MKTQVLILCTHNSSRSQMAQGLLRHLAGDQMEVFSAGTEPSRVNPFAIEAMQQRGIDITYHTSKHLSEYLQNKFDYVITVCDSAAESCPVFPGKVERIHWSFPDPSAVTGSDAEHLAAFVDVRNDLEATLTNWLQTVVFDDFNHVT
jgi:arsenate reductase